MTILQRVWTEADRWSPVLPPGRDDSVSLVFVFGAPALMRDKSWFRELREHFPRAHLVGCSTAGEICGTRVLDDSVVATAITFEHTQVRGASAKLGGPAESFEVGRTLARSLPPAIVSASGAGEDPLVHVVVLSDGLHVNGSALVEGLAKDLPGSVTVTGGLAADGAQFKQTWVLSDGEPTSETAAVVGFYGSRLRIGYGSLGGWDPFGPERIITRSRGNILYELDGQSALALYKKYLGTHAAGLPATGLMYPLSLRVHVGDPAVVRTILAVDEESQSLIFAGDVPEGSYARLMKANFDRLIDGAVGAARTACQAAAPKHPELAILISCVGRKLVLKQRVEEEVEGVSDMLGGAAVLAGFYSYGEIAPFAPGARCELHNQTMTIAALSEE